MARESVDYESLTKVNEKELLEAVAQENAQLRMELIAHKSVINKLINKIRELAGSDGEDFDED